MEINPLLAHVQSAVKARRQTLRPDQIGVLDVDLSDLNRMEEMSRGMRQEFWDLNDIINRAKTPPPMERFNCWCRENGVRAVENHQRRLFVLSFSCPQNWFYVHDFTGSAAEAFRWFREEGFAKGILQERPNRLYLSSGAWHTLNSSSEFRHAQSMLNYPHLNSGVEGLKFEGMSLRSLDVPGKSFAIAHEPEPLVIEDDPVTLNSVTPQRRASRFPA